MSQTKLSVDSVIMCHQLYMTMLRMVAECTGNKIILFYITCITSVRLFLELLISALNVYVINFQQH